MADNNGITEIVKEVGIIVTPIALAYIAYLQIRSGKKQAEIHKQINGLQEKMISAEKAVSKEEGKKEGIAEQKAEDNNKPT